jgi:hemoglobin/transferrin/lactoferrin receptor protein
MLKRKNNLTFILITSTFPIFSQPFNNKTPVQSNDTLNKIFSLKEVTVTSLRQDRKLKETAIPLDIIKEKDVDKLSPVTPADLMSRQPGVALYRDGIWATSISIRGMSEQRIVSLVDGNRIETATDIAGGLAMIDLNDIERIEIIKGGASSIYGTGALGGVVNFITSDGYYFDHFYIHGKSTTSDLSVNDMFSQSLIIKTGAEKWYLKAEGSYRDAQNTETPEGKLDNSQFRDNNVSVSGGIKFTDNQELKLKYQQFNANNVGIPGGTAFPANAIATYPKEQRTMFSSEYIISNISTIFSQLSIKYFRQYILRDVLLNVSPTSTITPHADHTTNGFTAQGNFLFGTKHSIIAGTDIWEIHLASTRQETTVTSVIDSTNNQINSNTVIRGEIPIPYSHYLSAGLFLQDEIKLIENKLNLLVGVRCDLIKISNNKTVDPFYIITNGVLNNQPPNQIITFNESTNYNTSWSANTGLLYKIDTKNDVTLNFSRAFRSPSLEERFQYIDLGSTVMLGNPKLKPENGYFVDLGSSHFDHNKTFSLNVFGSFMNNLIVEMPGIYVYNYSNNAEKFDTVKALINSNVDKAVLYGFDGSFDIMFTGQIGIFGNASYVRGKDTKNNTNLPQIEPLNGIFGIVYKIPQLADFTLTSIMAAKQTKNAVGETVTGGYARYDFTLNSKAIELANTKVILAGGIENLTNRAYRDYLTTNRGIIKLEPGRNFFCKLIVEF